MTTTHKNARRSATTTRDIDATHENDAQKRYMMTWHSDDVGRLMYDDYARQHTTTRASARRRRRPTVM